MKRKTTYTLPPDERIKLLKEKIGELRRDVIDMVPWKFRELIQWWREPEQDFSLAFGNATRPRRSSKISKSPRPLTRI
jgi:hypothetical protein